MDRRHTDMDFTLPPDLVTAHAASLRALARSLALDEHAADDVVQETWLRALSSPPAHHDGIGGWLRRVAEGFALKRHRSESRRADRERKYARERPEAVTSADTRAETLRVVVDAVLSLEDPYRETVLLRWFEGLPPRDIAARTSTSLATVNSRLQRAHTMLRERLSRRLGVDERKLQSWLIASFGSGHAHAGASLTLLGVTLTTTKLVAAACVAAASVSLFLFIGQHRESDRVPAVVAAPGTTPLEKEIAAVAKPDVDAQRVGLASTSTTAPTASTPVVAAGPFVFDLTVVPIDSFGRPVPRVPVRIGLELQRLAKLGSTAWNGELHTTWRGFEPNLDLVLELTGPMASTCPLRRIHLTAGSSETIYVAVERSQGGSLVRFSSALTLDAAPNIPSSPQFTVDEAGNGKFSDPWIVGEDESIARPARDMGNRIDEIRMLESKEQLTRERAMLSVVAGRRVKSIEDSARIAGIVRDEKGDPLPGVLVTTLTESDAGSWETTTDTYGRFDYAVPHGKAIVLAGGIDRALARQDIELAVDETRTLDIQCVRFEMTHVRLLDDQKSPLVGWHVEGRQSPRDNYLTGRGDCDENGRATLFMPEIPHARLYIRPPSTSARPEMKLEDVLVGRGADADVVLQRNASPGQIVFVVDAEHGEPIEVILWRADSNEGVRMPLLDVSAGSDVPEQREVFRVSNLLPGEYTLEFGSPHVPWKRIGPFFLQPGQTLETGTYTLDVPAIVKVAPDDVTKQSVVTVRTRVHGLWFEGMALTVRAPGRLLLMPGEWTIEVNSADKSAPKRLFGPETMKAESGRTITRDAGEASGTH